MIEAEKKLYSLFDSLGIKYNTIEHKPIFTVDEGRDFHHLVPGMHCKNLFMKDKKDKLWLIVMPGDKRANVTGLEKIIGSARLSFGKSDLLLEVLGVTPGTVTPFALMNDISRRVSVVLDSDMMKAGLVNFHPLRNDASTSLQASDLLMFIKYLSYTPQIVNCGEWVEV